MPSYTEAASKAVAEAENALRLAIDVKEPNYEKLEPLLERLRKTSQDYVFLVFPTSAAKSTEDRLWDGHVRVNKKFQKHLKQFREGVGQKKHVERRKAETHYLRFIKSSMQFYRGYIQRLASHYADVPEILIIAHKLHLDTLSVDAAVNVLPEHKDLVLGSCHSALMRLGDLSRYRETELETKNRNWGPAKGHYLLALSVKSESGAAYNQLAVMALLDEDHLRAVYYLHRAATTTKPFPVARDNIKLEFEKLLKLEPEEKSAISDTSKQTLEVLENRFLAFHANCHSRPSDYVTFSDKSTQMLQLITLSFEEIKDRSLDKLFQKMCLINIAAEHLAWSGVSKENLPVSEKGPAQDQKEKKLQERRLVEHERNCQAVYLFQRFNILTFTTLLKMLARELASEDQDADTNEGQRATQVSPAVGRLLAHVRQYSSWLLSSIHALLSPRHSSTGKFLEAFWKAYIKAVNLLLFKFPISEIPDLDYILDEDEESLSFAPFSQNVVKWRYHFDNGQCKPVCKLQPSDRPEDSEMLARIRRFVFDAATITNQKDKLKIDWAPIALVNGEFVYNEKAPPAEPVILKPSTPSQPFRSRAHAHANSLNGISPVPSPRPETPSNNTKAAAVNKDTPVLKIQQSSSAAVMESMVNNLVNSESENIDVPPPQPFNSSSILTGTPGAAPTPVNIMDLVRGMQQNPPSQKQSDIMDILRSMQHRSTESVSSPASTPVLHQSRLSNPSLPGIWNTAFTPRPGETTGSLPQSSATASTRLPSSTMPQSSSAFHKGLLQQEREIQLRTSPHETPFVSSWPESQRSPGFQQQPWKSGPISPWQSPSTQGSNHQPRELPKAALFGAIGDPRKPAMRTLDGGQTE